LVPSWSVEGLLAISSCAAAFLASFRATFEPERRFSFRFVFIVVSPLIGWQRCRSVYVDLGHLSRFLWHVEVKMTIVTIHTLVNLVPAAFANGFFFGEPETVAHGAPHDAMS
jgi:hypothetical protein